MRIAYIYYENIRRKKANIVQTLSMCHALGKKAKVDFFHSYIIDNSLKKILEYHQIKKNFNIVKTFSYPLIYLPFLEHLGRLIFFAQVTFLLKKRQYDLIFTRDFSFLYFLKLFPSLRPTIPIFYEAHKVYSAASQKVKSPKSEVDAINKNCQLVFTVTHHGMQDLRALGVKPRIIPLPNGVNLELFNSRISKSTVRQQLGLTQGNFIILYLGSFGFWKGADIFLEAAKHIKSPHFLFLAVGAKPLEKKKFQKKIFIPENTAGILIKKNQDRETTLKLLAAADVGVLPTRITSNGEGKRYTSPMKMFEYMASGLPIVASDLPSLREIIDERNALFFKSGDAADLADKLLFIEKNSRARKILAKNNLEKVKKYSLDYRVNIVLENFQKQ